MPERKALGNGPWDDLAPPPPPAAEEAAVASNAPAEAAHPEVQGRRLGRSQGRRRATQSEKASWQSAAAAAARWYRVGAYLEPEQGRWLDQVRGEAIASGLRDVGPSEIIRLALKRLQASTREEVLEALRDEMSSSE